ncbi:MAG: MarR family transcriptional regulator [Rhodobacteraceae bacterium]|jgi:DNA-binding MarR family transcriptional regulator|nr:MarR family transcriptional regulator [Paracoccaceae bacterium]MBT6542734.1 MarR family transcriptional regulator [Paracoccaceae bacterium]HBS38089.1 MarR family transcriptional regulator [Paracoccaceae bacterium]
MTPDLTRTHDLVDRLYRLNAAGDWADTLNPTQRMALAYLARANRFSRCPSHVAEYMALTRGTASQTLKALVRKKLICSQRSSKDGRSISYQVTEQGLHVLGRVSLVEQVMQMMDVEFIDTFNAQLAVLLRQALTLRQNKTFGLCRSCRHHKKTDLGGHCGLLNEPLHAGEELQICQEFTEKAPGMDTLGD